MELVNKLTPESKGKAFDPDWFLLAERFRAIDKLLEGGQPNTYEARMDAYGRKIDELKAHTNRLRKSLQECAYQAEKIENIRYGYDGDCGATNHANAISEICAEILDKHTLTLWKPIESAPYGEWFFAWAGTKYSNITGLHIVRRCTELGQWTFEGKGDETFRPDVFTHWMPIEIEGPTT